MIVFKGVLLIFGGIIALLCINAKKLPSGLLEWLIWALDVYIIITEVIR